MSLVATNATSVRVRFTLPQILVGLIGHAELHYTSNALIPRYEWNVQKFARPNRLFDTPNIEYHLNNLKSDTTYYFQIKVLVEALQSGPESDVYKLKMPSFLSGSSSSSPVSSILPSSNSISPSVTSTASTTTLPPVILIDARISAAISEASDLPSSRGGPVINSANEVSVTVTWRPLDKKEKRLIDAIQVKYRKIDETESTAKVSGLIHRDLTSHTIRHLQPGASYLIDLLFKPDESVVTSSTTLVSSKPIVVELPLAPRNQLDLLSPILPLDVQNDLHVEGTRVLFKLRSLPRPVNKFVTVVKITYKALTRDGSSDLAPSPGGPDDGSDNDHPGLVDNNDEHLMSRDSRGAGGTSHSSSSSSSASSSASASSSSSSASASSSSSPSSPSASSGSDSLHHYFKQPSEDGHILLEGLLPRRKYKAWIECYLVNGRISSSGAIDFTTKDATASRSDGSSGSKKAFASPDEDPSVDANALNEALASETTSSRSNTPGNQLLNTSHSVKSDELKPYYLALTIVALFAALTSIAFLSLLCIMLRSKSSAKAPITRGSPSPIGSATCDQAYDNPSYKSCEGDLSNSNSVPSAAAMVTGARTNGGSVSVNGTTNIRLNGLTTSSLTMSSNCNSTSTPTPSHAAPPSSSPSSLNSSSTADSNNSNVLNNTQHHHLHHHHNNLNFRLATSNNNSSVSHNNQGSHQSSQQQLHLHQIHLSHRPNGSNNGSSSIKLNGLNAGSAIIGSAQV